MLARDLRDHRGDGAWSTSRPLRALTSPARPIVLCRLRAGAPMVREVAPGLTEVGFFLPPTPLQQLLIEDGPPCR